MTDVKLDPLIDQLPSRYVVGIDLGTTNSAVSLVDTSRDSWKIEILQIPQLVAPGEIEQLESLPSFHFQPVKSNDTDASLKLEWDKKPPSYCVGTYARNETAKTSGRGIASAKSWLCHAAVDRSSELLPWHGADDVQRLSPVEVSARYLKHIRNAWDRRFPDEPLANQDIVLTLPASFDEVARELTVQAAAVAGLTRVVLIEEPQAAFYAWVDKHSDDWESRVEIGQKILVCDIGGGTTDFTLIRVRKSADESGKADKVQFHRVAVGNHLILGGDNLDLAIAKFLENKLTRGKSLEPYQWDVLVGTSRNVKEQLLTSEEDTTISVTLPGRGSRLLGGSLKTEVTSSEVRELILSGFLPKVSLDDRPQHHASGFQEFGLPYASDPAISKYLAEFLVTHATAGQDDATEQADSARPDVVLFNGGFFASPVLRNAIIEQIRSWFSNDSLPWEPLILENERLDLAVARGAAYYGMVRRDKGVRIAASLARSYYISIGGKPEQAVCLLPGNAEAGQFFELNQTFQLTISQPVEFSILVSSVRLDDAVGDKIAIDLDQMKRLPPIRTALKAKSRNEKRDIPVRIKVGLTEIGTIDLSCHEVDSERSWKLQFDVRAATQTDRESHEGAGESHGFVDEATWRECEKSIFSVFGSDSSEAPKTLVQNISNSLESDRSEWPMSVMRRIWSTLIELEPGRRKSPAHEARWLNLLGYTLRPGYGIAMDDWRVTETWRHVNGKLIHGTPSIRNESLILWRRLAGGLSRGQQAALANPILAQLRALAKKMKGQKVKGNAIALRPEESVEAWRLLGSLEWLSVNNKQQLGDMIIELKDKPKLAPARDAMVWTLGRLGQRKPWYGPLNGVIRSEKVEDWIRPLVDEPDPKGNVQLAVIQMSRKTEDRYRDISKSLRTEVLDWLSTQGSNERWVELVALGGTFDQEEQGRVLGESLPQGLRLE